MFGFSSDLEARKLTPEPAINDVDLRQAQLRQFLFWMTIATFSFAVFEGCAFFFFRDGSTGATALMLGLLGTSELVALHTLLRNRLRDAIVIFYIAMSTFTVTVGFTQPFALPGLIACSLLPLGVALPYLERHVITRMIFLSWGIALATVAIIRFAPHPSLPEPWFIDALHMSSFGAALGLLLLLLWQYRSRLGQVLQAARTTNETLQLAQVELGVKAAEAVRLRQVEEERRRQVEHANEQLQAAQAELELKAAEAASLRQLEEQRRLDMEHVVATYLAFVRHVGQGDLTRRLTIEDKGVLNELGAELNAMVESLQQLTIQIQSASSSLMRAAAEILSATTQQGAASSQQASSITENTTTIEEVKRIAEQTAERASEVARDSQAALQIARQGTQTVEEMIDGMLQIRERVDSIAHTILQLAEQNQAIETIIQTVNELADQSNLLALNAAIEAARAGAQGKSFAVVAHHVRNLAERSKAATAQVREILGEIQRTTNAAVLVTEEGTKGVEAGARMASQAREVIHQITHEVGQGAQANLQMTVSAQQQMVGMEQIGQAMDDMRQMTTQTLSSIRQTERAAQDLNTLAQSLQKAVATYRL